MISQALAELLEVIEAEKVEGTCTRGTCHWPAVARQAFLAREELDEMVRYRLALEHIQRTSTSVLIKDIARRGLDGD